MNYFIKISLLIVVIGFTACAVQNVKPKIINAGNDPNFKIVANTDKEFRKANRKVMVFGIPIYAFKEVEDEKLLHAANIMAQYLDNNEDGIVDNPTLMKALKDNNAGLYIWKTEAQQGALPLQDLGADESIPEWHKNNHFGEFDAALEEVWHVITHSGYANAYPEVFGEQAGTELANAMDIARGGQFKRIPKNYPDNAWYSYDDSTCDYECMATEYIYWGMSSKLGAQANRANEIANEWRLHTKALFESNDKALNALLDNPKYKFPKVLPDGIYKR